MDNTRRKQAERFAGDDTMGHGRAEASRVSRHNHQGGGMLDLGSVSADVMAEAKGASAIDEAMMSFGAVSETPRPGSTLPA